MEDEFDFSYGEEYTATCYTLNAPEWLMDIIRKKAEEMESYKLPTID